jgi:hypothetical protein
MVKFYRATTAEGGGWDRNTSYRNMPAVHDIEAGRDAEAHARYRAMVAALRTRIVGG